MPSRARAVLGAVFVAAGAMHFVRPGMYETIVPDYLPAHTALVYASGAAEIAGGVAVLGTRTRRAGGWGLIATMVGVLPAHVHMIQNAGRYPDIPEWALWIRLPLQALIVAVIYRVALRDLRRAAARCGGDAGRTSTARVRPAGGTHR